MSNTKRQLIEDCKFETDQFKIDLENKLLKRAYAKKIKFHEVNFVQTIFETSYFRGCVFVECDFTGCIFMGCNFYGANFNGCKFDYATFHNTIVDSEILKTECPPFENLKLKFARTLRTNYQSIGDSDSVNLAIKVELKATEEHLKKAWNDNSSYYRNKYTGWKRVEKFIEWLRFKALDLLWGNGESIFKLIRSMVLILFLTAVYDAIKFHDGLNIMTYVKSFFEMPQVYAGFEPHYGFSKGELTIFLYIRLVLIALFISILTKRLSRR